MRRIPWIILCISLVLGLFTGCANEEKPYEPTGNGLTWDEDDTAPQTEPSEPVLQALNLTYYPDRTLNPITCTDFTNRALLTLLYQGLFSVDRNYQVEPVLCKSFVVSEDMRTYTFYPEQVTFSNGKMLTAEDVLASLTAAKESAYYGGRFQYVNEMTLSEDGGVTIALNTSYENLPLLLDIPIIPAEQVDEDFPDGTGPYRFTNAGTGAYLRKRRDWWYKGPMLITAETIALYEAESPTQIRDSFEFTDLSLVCADPGSDRYVDYRSDYELWDCENGIFLYLACCEASEVFSVPEVRAALTYAIDRETLVNSFYRGFARPATLPASPLFPHYSDSLAAKYEYNSLKFAKAVQAAGLRDSKIQLLVNREDTLRLRVARAIGQMLEDCGLVVEMLELSGSEYQFALDAWNYDLLVGQTKLSANMDLSAFFSSYGALSYGGLSDVGTYTLCQQALENHGNYYSLHQTVMADGMLCPVLFRSYAIYATRGLLTGLEPTRDSVFHYSVGKTLEDVRTVQKAEE